MGNCWGVRIKSVSPTSSLPTSCENSRSSGKGLSGSTSLPPTSRSKGEMLPSSKLKSFTFSELKSATRKFHPNSVIGQGGFGPVFKGWINEQTLVASKPGTGIVIAVKRLNKDGVQGHREWLAEVNYLGQFYHPNLVKLIGYCIEDDHRLLVYEFMPKGSLENHLFKRSSNFQPLSWNLRIKVALGAAKALAFLHKAENNVIYRDFKTSNILLDSNYNAKLSDFGLAKDGPTGDESHVSTRVMGINGAPEYFATGHLTMKSDVYSFGVVFLEMISGKRAMDIIRQNNEQNLIKWVRSFLNNKHKIFRVIDPTLEGQFTIEAAQKAVAIAVQCLSEDSRYRPTMDEVVISLQELNKMKDDSSAKGEDGDTKVSYPGPAASPRIQSLDM